MYFRARFQRMPAPNQAGARQSWSRPAPVSSVLRAAVRLVNACPCSSTCLDRPKMPSLTLAAAGFVWGEQKRLTTYLEINGSKPVLITRANRPHFKWPCSRRIKHSAFNRSCAQRSCLRSGGKDASLSAGGPAVGASIAMPRWIISFANAPASGRCTNMWHAPVNEGCRADLDALALVSITAE